MIKLQKGDIVDIIFPATCCTEKEISEIKNYVIDELQLYPRILLEDEVTPTTPAHEDNFLPSYPAQKRFEQLYQALISDSKIIWCARGGYGSGDLLPLLANSKKVTQNKLFIGFSDITSINNFLQEQWHWQTLTAPLLYQLSNKMVSKESADELKALLFGEKNKFDYQLIELNEFGNNEEIEAEIHGGCLSVLTAHFGGAYQINFHDKILFLEDQGESGERLDRYFCQIIEAVLHKQQLPKAILLGNFMESNSSGNPTLETVRKAIDLLIQRIEEYQLKIPVLEVREQNLGHSTKMRPLMLGKKVKITKNKILQLYVETI